MASNSAVRAAVSGDLTKFRANGDGSFLGLAIQHPAIVCTADINQTFDSLDGVVELTVDNAIGYADVVVGETVIINSSADVYKGTCRVRQLPTSTKIYINQDSKIPFAEDDKIIILNSLELRQRDLTQTGGIVRMDYDIEFGDYRNNVSIPRIAPMVAVINQTSGTITFTPPSPALSACYDGSTIASVLYEAPGATTMSNMTSGTGTASWTYPLTANQEYRWSCKLILDTGAEITSYRWVFVNPTAIPFKFEDCTGDFQDGNWSFTFTCYDDVEKTEVYDRALVTLYSIDYYGGVVGSIGKIAGYENIWASGWIDGDSTTYDSEKGEVTFTVRGPAFWMSKLRAMPITLQDVTGVPASWGDITEMTADKALAFLLFWTSTAPFIMDCFFTGDTTRQKIFALPGGPLLDQLKEIAGKIFATPLANNYGQMVVEVDSQLISSADRSALPVVMDITKVDRKDGLEIQRNQEKVAMVELGAYTYDGTTLLDIHSRAPGNTGGIFGDIDSYNDYMIVDQDECNRISGCLLSARNGEFDPLEIPFPTLIKLFDICPRMYATITVLAVDNPRGLALTTARLIPRTVKYVEDASGVYSTEVTFEIETIGVDGVTYVPPMVADNGIENYDIGDLGGFGNIDFPNSALGSYFPDSIPPSLLSAPCTSQWNSYNASWDKPELRGDSADRIAKIYFPCKVRPKSYNFASPSKLTINGTRHGDSAAHLTLYGVKGGARVVTADSNFEFDPVTPIEVDGFELELDTGLGSIVQYIPGEIYATGTINSQATHRVHQVVIPNTYMSFEDTGGPWYHNGAPQYSGVGTWANDSYVNGAPPFGPPSLFAENVDATHVRRYGYMDSFSEVYFFVQQYDYSENPTHNSGSLGYIIRYASVNGRRITLTSAIVQNICPVA